MADSFASKAARTARALQQAEAERDHLQASSRELVEALEELLAASGTVLGEHRRTRLRAALAAWRAE
jgi:hypothetical protein